MKCKQAQPLHMRNVVFHTMKEQTLHRIVQLFSETVAEVSEDYFLLPVAGLGEAQQRERNYCYELYRLLRNNWPADLSYQINGEVDKTNHPFIEKHCGKIKPDFIVHNSGMMGANDNLLIVEVKTTSGAKGNGLLKDIQTLNCMTSIPNGYHSSLLLIAGPSSDAEQNQIIERINDNLNNGQAVYVIFHFEIGVPASIFYLNN